MSLVKPGDFITTNCRRCSDITGHTVMLLLGGVIEKVECRACGSVHKYRESVVTGGKKKSSPAVRHVRRGQNRENAREIGSSVRSRSTSSASQRKIESAWQEAMMRNSNKEAIPYTLQNNLDLHMLIEHPVFGRGEVITLIKPDKAEILFQSGVKLLKCTIAR